MKSYPSCWNKTLAQLGFRRKLKKHNSPRQYGRRALFENLESREMLTAQTFWVDTLADQNDGAANGMSLRDAITAANATPDADIIDFVTGLTGTIEISETQLPAITQPLTIDGPGADKLAVSGEDLYRVFQINPGVTATLEGLTIKDGYATSGGGIYNNGGNLTLDNVAVVGNKASNNGGGVFSIGSLTVVDSTVSDNVARYGGGISANTFDSAVLRIERSEVARNVVESDSDTFAAGVFVQGSATAGTTGGVVGIIDSTIADNVSRSLPGRTDFTVPKFNRAGLYLYRIDSATIVNSTISNNVAEDQVGGVSINDSRDVSIVSSTIAFNASLLRTIGGLQVIDTSGDAVVANVALHNTLVAGNTSIISEGDVSGPFSGESSYNLIGTGAAFAGTDNVLLQGADPKLAPLADYGGPAKTHALLPGSLALDAGTNVGLAIDQRGFARQVGAVDIGATESPAAIVGDFDGDHRDDVLQFDAGTGVILVVINPSDVAQISKWGQLDDSVTWINPYVGDFNGDGRDDLMAQNYATKKWTVALSDGNAFFEIDTQTGNAWTENKIRVGDFDGDGSQELIGQIGGGQRQVLRYSEVGGAVLTNLSGPSPVLGGTVYVGDANRDGRDDLIYRNSSSNWTVALSEVGGTSFAAAISWGGWFESAYQANNSNFIDAPYQKVLNIFSDIYNNYELEFYPGLMKGPDATEQTKAGNDWDQAALLVKKLEALPELEDMDVSIATGLVTAPVSVLKEWIGSPDTSTGTALRDKVRDLMNQLGILTFNGSTTTTLLFRHVWVEAKVPSNQGFIPVFLDPSWKFKNRNLDALLYPSSVVTPLQPFDQLDYLTSVREELALEYYEDKLMDHLAASHPGKSLADVPYDGPIRTRAFDVLPAGLGEQVIVDGLIPITTYDNFDSILSDPLKTKALTHRVVLELTRLSDNGSRNNVELFETEIVVPDAAYERFTITTSIGNDPDLIIKEKIGSTTTTQTISASGNLLADESVRLRITHLNPGQELGNTGLTVNDYEQEVGTVIAIGLDANQFTTQHIADLQEYLFSELTTVDAGDIDDLLSYTVAAYWQDDNQDKQIVAGLMNKAYTKMRVGSGVATSQSTYDIVDHLNYKIAPDNMGVDLKNSTGFYYDWAGNISEDANRLAYYNASGLEHTIVEETINSASVSTVKGLQRAYQRTFGIDDENGAPVNNDKIHGFDSYWNASLNQREFYYRGEWAQGLDTFTDYATANLPQSAKLNSSQVQAKLTNVPVDFKNKIISALNDTTYHDDIHILVSDARTKLDEWVGGVYMAESFGDGQFSITMSIAPDNGPVQNGGYSAGVVTPPNPFLPPTDFTYSTFAGDPVNTANGAMFRDDVDIVYPNIGVPLDFARHYNSNNKDDIGMGVGWTHSFGDLLIKDPDSASNLDLVWITSNGQRHKLKRGEGGFFELPPSLQGEFYLSGGTYTYKDKSGMVYQFDGIDNTINGLEWRGRLISQVDKSGNGVVVTYAAANLRRILQVQDVHAVGTNDRRLVFTFSGNYINSISKYDTAFVGEWEFAYKDPQIDPVKKHLITVTNPTDIYLTTALQLRYDYYETGNSQGLISKITELHDPGDVSAAAFHTYDYYANGRVFRVTDSNGKNQTYNYNLFRTSTEFVDENGHSETYIHQLNGLLEKQIHDDRTRQEFTWGIIGQPSEFLMTTSTDELGAIETFKYYVLDADYFEGTDHEVVIITNTFRDRELYEATAKRFPTDPALITRFDYSSPGGDLGHIVNLKSTIVDVGDATHQNLTTDFDYDPLGRLITTTDPFRNVTTREYYDAGGEGVPYREGLLKAEIGPRANGNTSLTVVNGENVSWEDLISSLVITGDTISVRAAFTSGMIGSGVVDIDAIRIERIDGDFPFVKIVDEDNDGLQDEFWTTGGLPTPTINDKSFYYLGDRLALNSTDDSATWVFSGLEPGTYRVSATWKASGNRYTNAPFYVVEGTDFTGATVIPVNQQQVPSDLPAGFKTVFNYDAAGNVTSARTDGIPTSTNAYHHTGSRLSAASPSGVANTYAYNVLGWQQTATLDPMGAGTNQTSTFSYDAAGRLLFSTDPLDRQTEFVYDLKGQLVAQKNADGTQITYEYDGVGNRTSVTDELGRETRFVYDGRNRLIETIYCDGTSSRILYNGTGQIAATFDELGRETKFTYDAQGRLKTTTNADLKMATNNFDLVGRLTWAVDFNQNRTEFKYDQLGRVTETRSLSADQTSILALSTTDYDANGNVIRQVRYDAAALGYLPSNMSDPRTLIAANPTKVQVTDFRYDALDRPIETIHADGTSTRTVYDNDGRVLYAYDELNRKSEFQYDVYGRLAKTLAPDPDGPTMSQLRPETEFQYDAAGNQVKVIDPNGNATEFTYDSRNRLVTTTDALGGQMHTLHDVAGQIVATVDALGHVMFTLRDKRGRTILAREADPDGDGALLASETRFGYDAVGNLIEKIDAIGNFTQYEYDDLNRVMTETLTDASSVRIVDDGDAGFTDIKSFYTTGEERTPGFNGDYLFLTHTNAFGSDNAIADYQFVNLPAGTYRILATWIGHPDATQDLSAQVLGLSQGTVTLTNFDGDQRTASDEVFRYDDGLLSGWVIVDDGNTIKINEPDNVTIRLRSKVGSGGLPGENLLADAVRLERIYTHTYSYDDNGNLLSETDTLGRVTTYEYDALDRQTMVTLPDPDETSTGNPSPETETKYDGFGNVKQTIEQRGGQPRTTEYTYDKRNRVLTETLDKNGAQEVITQYGYDFVGNLTLRIDDAVNAAGHVYAKTEYVYDNLDRQIFEKLYPDASDTTPLLTHSQYDANGNLTRSTEITYASSVLGYESITEYEYDQLNRLISEAQVESQVIDDNTTNTGGFTIYSGSGAGGTTGYAGDGLLIGSGTPTTGAKWSFANLTPGTYRVLATWDGHSQGAGLSVVNLWNGEPGQGTLALSTTVASQLAAPTGVALPESYGNIRGWQVWADDLEVTGNLLTMTHTKNNSILQADAVRLERVVSKSTFSYDAVGNLIATTDPLGFTSLSEYDRLNRLTRSTSPDPDGNPLTDNTPFMAYSYDALGRLVAETNGEGETMSYAYDALGNVVRETDGLGQTTGKSTVKTYDSEGNLLSITDPEGNKTTYTYDNLSRIKTDTITLAGLPATRTYTYDSQGNLSEYLDREQRKTGYSYDRLNRMTFEYWFDASGSIFQYQERQYDKLGRVTLAAEHDFPGGATRSVNTHDYDDLGRITEVRNYPGALPTSILDVKQVYEYDVLASNDYGATLRTNYSQYSFDGAAFDLIGTTTTFVDQRGRVSRIKDTPAGQTLKEITFTYDDANRLTGIARESGSFSFDTTYAYDNAGRVTGINHYRDGSTSVFTAYGYEYDQANRITDQLTVHDTTIGAFSALQSLVTEAFDFDAAGQLTDVDLNGVAAEGFTYDDNGNRTLSTANGTTDIGDYNRLEEDADYTYLYDKEGNRTRRTAKTGGAYTVYTWDHRNRLTSVVDHDSSNIITGSVEYAYDAEDRRVQRERYYYDEGEVQDFLVSRVTYNGRNAVLEIDTEQGQLHRYLWAPIVDQLLADDDYWAATDHLGTVNDLLDSSEAIVEHREYDSFGAVDEVFNVAGQSLGSALSPKSDVAFQGKRYDSFTDFYDFDARPYDPRTGTFPSVDPARDGSNWYAAFGNDPWNTTDPTGLSAQGNPLNNLYGSFDTYAGGFSGGRVEPYKPININPYQYVAPKLQTQILSTGLGYSGGLSVNDYSLAPRTVSTRSSGQSASISTGSLVNYLSEPTQARSTNLATKLYDPLAPSLASQQIGRIYEAQQRAASDQFYQALIAPDYKNVAYGNRSIAERRRESADLVTQYTPGLNDVRDFKEFVNGYDSINERQLSTFERVVTGVALAVPFALSGRTARNFFRTESFDSHSLRDIQTSQRYTQQIDVPQSSQYYDPIDVYAGSYVPTRSDVLLFSADPRVRAGYDPGTIQLDHEIAQVFGGSTTRQVPAGLNLRKGGLEGELRRYENYLIRNNLDPDLARQVIYPEIESLSRDVIAAPFTSVYRKGFSIDDIDQ